MRVAAHAGLPCASIQYAQEDAYGRPGDAVEDAPQTAQAARGRHAAGARRSAHPAPRAESADAALRRAHAARRRAARARGDAGRRAYRSGPAGRRAGGLGRVSSLRAQAQNVRLAERRRLIAVARGSAPADLYVRGGTLLNVYTGEVYPANVAVSRERIAYVGLRDDMVGARTTILDAAGRVLVPGYVDPHVHPAHVITPSALARHVVALGTT